MRINASRIGQSPSSPLFSAVVFLTVDSLERLTRHMPPVCANCRPLHHNQSKAEPLHSRELLFLSSISVQQLSQWEAVDWDLTERVQPIHFSCIAESLSPPPYLSRSHTHHPVVSHLRRMGQGAGHAVASCSTRHAGP